MEIREGSAGANRIGHRKRTEAADYEIMHGEDCVARINTRGAAVFISEQFCPYDLYLEEGHDFDVQIDNMNNFYHWCASRVLTLDRKVSVLTLNRSGTKKKRMPGKRYPGAGL